MSGGAFAPMRAVELAQFVIGASADQATGASGEGSVEG